jgi:TRAP-type C4-dicarboxylate transport system substrate-binding protein
MRRIGFISGHRARGRSVGRRGGGEATYELKFNTVDVPMQPEYKATEVFGKNLEALSAGKIKVRTFHLGQLDDHQDLDRRTPRRSK